MTDAELVATAAGLRRTEQIVEVGTVPARRAASSRSADTPRARARARSSAARRAGENVAVTLAPLSESGSENLACTPYGDDVLVSLRRPDRSIRGRAASAGCTAAFR